MSSQGHTPALPAREAADPQQDVVLVRRASSPAFSDSSYTSASTDDGVHPPSLPPGQCGGERPPSPRPGQCGGKRPPSRLPGQHWGRQQDAVPGEDGTRQHATGTLADVRLRVFLCRKAWSLLFRSKMTVFPLSSLTKFPAVAVLVLGGLLLAFTVLRPLASSSSRVPVTAALQQVTTNMPHQVFVPSIVTPAHNPHFVDNRIMAGDIHPMVFRGKRLKTNGKWASLGHDFPREGYLYSAFYDDRKSLGQLPVIRIIAVLEEFKGDMYCTMYYQQKKSIEHALVAKSDIGAGVTRHNKEFKEYILSCPMNHEVVPDTVGIVSDLNVQPDSMIPVEMADRPAMRYNFGVCVSVTYWKQDPHHIVEWLELLRIMGASRVTIYNNSLEDEAARVFQEYDREGFVEFRQSHNFIPDPGELTIHMHMSPVINDCMYRGMYRFKKIIVTDFDELIVPRTVENYVDMIAAIDKRQCAGNEHPAKHYIFRNNYFFLDIPGEDQTQSPHIMTLRHRKKIPISEPGYAIKSIIDPLSCMNMHNHYCWKSTPLYENGYEQIEVAPELALNQHYKNCHLDLWEKPGLCKEMINASIQDDIMLRYKSRLERQMAAKLEKLHLNKL